jgi:hypothetical protein
MPQYLIHYDQGNSPGPFNIYLTGSSGPASLYAAGVTRLQLENGYIVTFDDAIPSSSVLIDNTAYGCATEETLVFPTPTPTKTPSISITPTITRTPSITPTRTPTITPSLTATPTLTPVPTITPSQTPTITPSQTFAASITPTPTITPTRTITPTPTTTPPTISYFFMGTVSGYGTEIQACANANCGRSFYGRYSTLVPGNFIYNDASLLSSFNGSGNWYALSFNCTGTFYACEIQSNGAISQVYDCDNNAFIL